ncbi:sulfite exporter TauE/SafE family protein [Pasteurella bettyae]|uniref:Probable membrane transporter protein n=1 Tax=Pasteurella bettyae CCUG 2042 TaxID=1095749 RepID=I3DJC7_9PAST|nr:sulfite exporter TauE/SafE family protein [Pasteurella bettyae]EIJ71820.1 sulfite exporter TauE/SafE [Pasteurella bettyae CCUG 2042]
MLTFFIITLLVGTIVGFLAGIFGIGGGLVIVPTLLYLLPMVGVPDEKLMATALGTSFATIIFTSLSSAYRHNKMGNVVWETVKYLAPSAVIAIFISGLFIGKLPKDISSKLFALLVVYLAIKMVLSIRQKKSENTAITPLTPQKTILGGIGIGIASSTAGIGGGSFIVPFLNSHGIEMKKAIGSSSFCGAFLGCAGMFSFMIGGWATEGMPNWSLGYIYLPAVLGIMVTSFFTSKLGAEVANKLPVTKLKTYFAIFLILMAIKMILG